MERTNEIILQNTTLENVLRYLFEKLKTIVGETIERTADDGTIHYYCLQNVFPSHTNKIEVKYTTTVTPQGNVEKAHGYWGDQVAMSFEGLQLQTNTVLIKAECKYPFMFPIFDRFWGDMLKAFRAALPLTTDSAQFDNIIADHQGGTITYKRNEQGQTIPTGGAVNPGYYVELGQGVAIKPEGQFRLNHTTGNFQPGLYPSEEKDSIIKVTSETLAGLTDNTDRQAAQTGTTRDEMTKENTVQSVLETRKKVIPLGTLLYKAAKDVVAMSPQGVMPDIDSLSASEKNSRIIMSYSFSLATRGNEFDTEAEIEFFKSGYSDFFLPKFAAEFLKKFPTLSSANEKFSRLISLYDFHSKDTRITIDQILNLTVEEASTVIKAKPLLAKWKNEFASLGNVQDATRKSDKTKQGGRYRLTRDEIKRRKQIVKDAERTFKESGPNKTWKQIAYELDIPERTLRDWRHNPTYK